MGIASRRKHERRAGGTGIHRLASSDHCRGPGRSLSDGGCSSPSLPPAVQTLTKECGLQTLKSGNPGCP